MHKAATSTVDSIQAILNRIEDACHKAKRDPRSVKLLAVSKGQTNEQIEAAYQAGLRHFGENYVQEWQEKSKALAHLSDLKWHFIGHLQSNKAKLVSDKCFSIDSVDRASIAEILERGRLLAVHQQARLRVLIQMQVDETDANKSGIRFSDCAALCKFIAPLSQLEWAGFMGIGPLGVSGEALEALYKQFVSRARTLWQEHAPVPSIEPVISLGMSSDLEIAILAGSTEVRIGSALFGERTKKAKG